MSKAVDQPKVPKLRFPEFEGEWELTSLGCLSKKPQYGLNASAVTFNGNAKYIRITDIDEESRAFAPNPLCSPDCGAQPNYKVQTGDILFTRTGASTGKTYLYSESDGPLYFAGFLIRFAIVNAVASFVYAQTLRRDYLKWVGVFSMRSGQPGINADEYSSYTFFAPPVVEQRRVADLLFAMDVRIELLRQRRAALEAYKKGMMQRLFSRELRFTRDDGSPFPDWQEKRLSEVLDEHGERSTGKERVHSVSVHKGVIDQIEHLGRSFAAANTDHYGLVKSGDVIYTKSPTGDFPFGIIKQNRLDEKVIVSPLYGVFTPETHALGYILNDHFLSVQNTHNCLHQLVQKGAKNTINITNSGFLEGKLMLPVDPDEQKKIADFLSALDTKIDAVASQIDAMQRLKKGLLQQMFV